MGNCLPKHKKKNRVEPAPTRKKERKRDEVLRKSTELLKPNKNDPADMVKALSGEGTGPEETVKLDAPVDNKKAITFTVDLEDKDTKTKVAPKRLAGKLQQDKPPKAEIAYTNDEEDLMAEILMEADVATATLDTKKNYNKEEKTLMAEIMRDDRLKQIKERAVQEDVKIYDAKRRRMVAERSMEAKVGDKMACCTASGDDQRQKVRELAAEDRRRAAESRRKEEQTE